MFTVRFTSHRYERDESMRPPFVSVDYYLGVMAYISLGFDVLIVNYRGSIGFGQGTVTSASVSPSRSVV